MINPQLEDVPARSEALVSCIHRTFRDLATDHGWHFHPQYELTLFLRSSGVRYVGDSVARYGPGDLVLSGPNLPHCWRNDVVDGGDDAEWLTVQFEADFLGTEFLGLPEAVSIAGLLSEAKLGLAFSTETASVAEPAMRKIARSHGLICFLKLAELLNQLTSCKRKPLAKVHYHRDNVVDLGLVQKLEQVNRYIAAHFRGTVNQAELAGALGLTAVAFSKFMRSATGRSFSEMVKIARINEACRLLASGSDRITDVALDSGYQHTSHFDRHFVELKGMTPSEYRQKMRMLGFKG